MVQLIIIILFSLSLSLAIFIFQQIDHLSQQSTLLYALENDIYHLRDEINLISYKPQSINASYYALNDKVKLVQKQVVMIRENLLSRKDRTGLSATLELIALWDELYLDELGPLLSEMNSLDPLLGYYQLSQYGLRGSLTFAQINRDDPLVSILDSLLQSIDRLHPRIGINLVDETHRATERLNREIEVYGSTMIRYALIAMGIMFVISIAIAWYLSHSIGKNIKNLDTAIAQVARGNFQHIMESGRGDEFQEIARDFNTLTEMLWFRLDTLKDLMRDVSQAIENESSTEELHTLILELAIDSTGADSAIIMLFDEKEKGLVMGKQLGYFPPPLELPQSVRMKQETMQNWLNTSTVPLTGNILGETAVRGSFLYIHDNENQRVLPHNHDKDSINFIGSAIFLGLRTSDKRLGVIGLAKTSPRSFFNDLDFTYMKSYANFVTITLDNFAKYQRLIEKHEINREIEVAAEIQSTLLPEKMPPMKNTRIAAFSHAAKGVSGDYYDVFSLDNMRTAVVICDISGKGIPASLFMVMFRTVLRTVAKPDMNSSEILTAVNREIFANFQSGTFATASLLIINHFEHTISYSNGAHHPLYIYRSGKKGFVKFDTEGLPLGIDMRGAYGHNQIRVSTGDYLFLFTDGLTEARNTKGEELGTGRLLKFASQYVDKSPERMVEMIGEMLEKFKGKADQHDDETFLAVRIDS